MTPANLRKLREAKGLSQREVAVFAGITPDQIHRVEAGVSSMKLRTAEKIAALLGVTVGGLFPAVDGIRAELSHVADDRRRDSLVLELSEADGVDLDHRLWNVRFDVPKWGTHALPISGWTARRLVESLESGNQDFLLFDTTTHRCAVRNGTFVIQLSFEETDRNEGYPQPSTLPAHGNRDVLTAHIRGLEVERMFPVEPDRRDRPIQHLFEEQLRDGKRWNVTFLSRGHGDASQTTVFIPRDDVLALFVPLEVVEPSLRRADDD